MNATPMLAAWGRLAHDPEQRRTRRQTRMAVAVLAVPVPPAGRADSETTVLWLRVVAFGRLAGLLLRHRKGDPVSVAGRLQVARWVGRDGKERESWQALANSIVSARTARPGGSAPPKAAAARTPSEWAQTVEIAPDLDDAPDF